MGRKRKILGLGDKTCLGQFLFFIFYFFWPLNVTMLQTSHCVSHVSAYGSGSINPSMHGPFAGVRGPFTPSQWIELEHQALIYKYMTSNVPVPSNLLIPLKKSLYPYGLSGSTGNLAPNSCKLLL